MRKHGWLRVANLISATYPEISEISAAVENLLQLGFLQNSGAFVFKLVF
jgi:hypothetical protein